MAARDPGERTALEMAHAYARVGWPVFPISAGSKLPAIPAAHPPGDIARSACAGQCGRLGHGFHDATTDPAVIDRWWGRHPDCNVGIATGQPGPDVLDIDVHEDGSGFAALNRVKRAGLADSQQAIVKTPSGGMHLYYRGTDQHNGSVRDQHVDFRSKGGYVVAPPSSTPAGSYVVVQHRPGEVATLDFGKVREVLEPEALRRQRELAKQAAGRQPAGRGDEGRVGRLTNFVAEGRPHDRNFRVFYAAKQLALSGQLDQGAIESLVGAALRSGLRGGEAEARRSIASGQRDALTNDAQPTVESRAAADRDGDRQRPFVPSRHQAPDASVRPGDMTGLFTPSASKLAALVSGVCRILTSVQYQEILHSHPAEVLDSPDRRVNPVPRPPLLEGTDDGAVFARLVPVIGRYGYRVEAVDAPDVDPAANGATWHRGRVVQINRTRSPLHQAKTAAHELAHVALHAPGQELMPPGRVRELQAEACAWVLLRRLGIDSGSFGFAFIAKYGAVRQGAVLRPGLGAVQRAPGCVTARRLDDFADACRGGGGMRGVRRSEAGSHGTRDCYNRGPIGTGPGCRCDDCTEANRDYKNDRERLIAYGRWQPFTDDVGLVRQHMLELSKAGIGRRQVAALAGLSPGGLVKVLYGQRGKPGPERIRPETVAAILAIEPAAGNVSLHTPVDGTGARRRLQALTAARWSGRKLAGELGISTSTFAAIMRGGRVTAATDEAVRALYSWLWDQPPPERDRGERCAATQAAGFAQRMGWAPPAAWEDLELDRPDGKPVEGWQPNSRTTHCSAELAEDAEFIMHTEGCGLTRAAERLGVSRNTLEQAMIRAAEYAPRQAAGQAEAEPTPALQLPVHAERDGDEELAVAALEAG